MSITTIIQVGIIPFDIGAVVTYYILQETGDALLLETGDYLLTEEG